MSVYTNQINKFLTDVNFVVDNENYADVDELKKEFKLILSSLFKNELVDGLIKDDRLEDFMHLFKGCENLFTKILFEKKEQFLDFIFDLNIKSSELIKLYKEKDVNLIHYILFLNNTFAEIIEKLDEGQDKYKAVVLMESLAKIDFENLSRFNSRIFVSDKKMKEIEIVGEYKEETTIILQPFLMMQAFFRNDAKLFAKCLHDFQKIKSLFEFKEKVNDFLKSLNTGYVVKFLLSITSTTETPVLIFLTDTLFLKGYCAKYNMKTEKIKSFREEYIQNLLELNGQDVESISINSALKEQEGIIEVSDLEIKQYDQEIINKVVRFVSILNYNLLTFAANHDVDRATIEMSKLHLIKLNSLYYKLLNHLSFESFSNIYNFINHASWIDNAQSVFNIEKAVLDQYRRSLVEKYSEINEIEFFTNTFEIRNLSDFVKVKTTLIESFLTRDELFFATCIESMAEYIYNCNNDEDFQIICEGLGLGLAEIELYFGKSDKNEIVRQLSSDLTNVCWGYEEKLLVEGDEIFENTSKVHEYDLKNKKEALDFKKECFKKLNINTNLDKLSLLSHENKSSCFYHTSKIEEYDLTTIKLNDMSFEEIEKFSSTFRKNLEDLYKKNDMRGFKESLLTLCKKTISDDASLPKSLMFLSVLMGSRFTYVFQKLRDGGNDKLFYVGSKNLNATLKQLIDFIINKDSFSIAGIVLQEGLVFESLENKSDQLLFKSKLNLNLESLNATKILINAVEKDILLDVQIIKNHQSYIKNLMIQCHTMPMVRHLGMAITSLCQYMKKNHLTFKDIELKLLNFVIENGRGRLHYQDNYGFGAENFTWIIVDQNYDYLKAHGLSTIEINNLYKSIVSKVDLKEMSLEISDGNIFRLVSHDIPKIEKDLILLIDEKNAVEFVKYVDKLVKLYDVIDLSVILKILDIFNEDELTLYVDNKTDKSLLLWSVIGSLGVGEYCSTITKKDKQSEKFKESCFNELIENEVDLNSLKDENLNPHEIALKYKILTYNLINKMTGKLICSDEESFRELIESTSEKVDDLTDLLIAKYKQKKNYDVAIIAQSDDLTEVFNSLKSNNKKVVTYLVVNHFVNYAKSKTNGNGIDKEQNLQLLNHLSTIKIEILKKLNVPLWLDDKELLAKERPEYLAKIFYELVKDGSNITAFTEVIIGVGKLNDVMINLPNPDGESLEYQKAHSLITRIWHDTSLAHRFDIPGDVKYQGINYSLDGSGRNSMASSMIDSFTIFSKSVNFTDLEKELLATLLGSDHELSNDELNEQFDKAKFEISFNVINMHLKYDESLIVKNLTANDIIAYPLSFKVQGSAHAVANVIFNVNGKTFLAHSDRSRVWAKNSGITIFEIKNKKQLSLILSKQISDNITSLSDEKGYTFENLKNDFLTLDLEEVFHVEKNKQVAGNCGWSSSARPLVEMISIATFMKFLHKIKNPDKEFDLIKSFEMSAKAARIIDSAFGSFDRNRELAVYKEKVTEPNLLLLAKIWFTSQNRENRKDFIKFIAENYIIDDEVKNEALLELNEVIKIRLLSYYSNISNDSMPTELVHSICTESAIKIVESIINSRDSEATYEVYDSALNKFLEIVREKNSDGNVPQVLLFSKAARDAAKMDKTDETEFGTSRIIELDDGTPRSVMAESADKKNKGKEEHKA